jgi:hypothetical protein
VRQEVTGSWTKSYDDDELHNLYSSMTIIRVTNSKRVTRMEHVARMGVIRNT